ncbi:MAG: hypothetical protein CL897_02325 [Dehalococcoidia bacterium]|nr:hypothetical protein [Dehalococcoidia bacterium]|tara:strand:- start:8961 stop:9392 length:432 start_codon:yes stop_codon:yes gene_type:complete
MSDEYSAIRQLCERYVDAINRRDSEAWVETWAPNGIWDYGVENPPKGREGLTLFWERAMANITGVVIVVNSGVVDSVNGNSATARWYHTEDVQIGEETRMSGVAVYEDNLVRIDGQWRFARRTHDLLYSGNDLQGNFHPYVTR